MLLIGSPPFDCLPANQALLLFSAPPVALDQVVSDFDGVVFHVSTPESKSKILISISIKCYRELVEYGAEALLEREYGPWIVNPEPTYNFSIQIDLDTLPDDPEGREDLIRRISLLRRNMLAAPFERGVEEYRQLHEEASKYATDVVPQEVKDGGQVMDIHYRDEEAIYIKAGYDQVTVVFSTIFADETDRIFGKVFLQVRH